MAGRWRFTYHKLSLFTLLSELVTKEPFLARVRGAEDFGKLTPQTIFCPYITH